MRNRCLLIAVVLGLTACASSSGKGKSDSHSTLLLYKCIHSHCIDNAPGAMANAEDPEIKEKSFRTCLSSIDASVDTDEHAAELDECMAMQGYFRSAKKAASSPDEIVFRNLSWPSPFVVRLTDEGEATWRTGIDASGSGYMCPEESEFYCLVLEGAWVFAIPREKIASPTIGATWMFEAVDFKLIEMVGLKGETGNERSIVVYSKTHDTTFNFSAVDGIQFISSIMSLSPDEAPDIFPSVWVNSAILAGSD